MFRCPDDSLNDLPAAAPTWLSEGWAGVPISYATNGYMIPTNTTGTYFHGVIGNDQNWQITAKDGDHQQLRTLGSVNYPSDTIMMTEKHEDDASKSGAQYGNLSGFAPGSVFDGVSWWDNSAPGEIPNGTNPSNAAYPNGPNGAVSTKHNDKANMLFTDGHVKTLLPYLTNPDPVKQPSKNLWDATRQ